jgi:adenylate cyclase
MESINLHAVISPKTKVLLNTLLLKAKTRHLPKKKIIGDEIKMNFFDVKKNNSSLLSFLNKIKP